MTVSRLLFASGLSLVGLLAVGLAPRAALGQIGPTASPAAPGDLSKPAFDTTTPVYDSVSSLDKAAATIVAEVEGRPITMGDVGDAIRALPAGLALQSFESLYPSVLEQLVNQQAMVVRAQQQGVDEEPAVRRRVKAAADRQLAEEYMRREISKGITEAALLDRYNKVVAGRAGPEEVRLRVILTGSQKAAVDLIAELRGGADFAAVARRASKDASAPAGGDLGFNPRERLSPEIGALAFAVPAGQLVLNPIQVAVGWFVVKVEEHRQSPTPGFPAVREQLIQALLREGVAPLAAAIVKDFKIRRYDFTGAEIDADKPRAR